LQTTNSHPIRFDRIMLFDGIPAGAADSDDG